jgi:ferredoxin-like protein FixX
MTKPTGRPRGRPKTREYTTLMARVDVVLADQVKRYASLHRQPISLVIRDALSLLMEEYPAEANPTGSHRLAAPEFLSDRYESPLDTLVGETDKAALEEFVSDSNKAAMALLGTDAASEKEYVSDTKEDKDILSDMNTEEVIVSDMNRDEENEDIVSDTKAVPDDIVSDTKEDDSDYNPATHSLGKLCPRKHSYRGSGQSVLRLSDRHCLECDRLKSAAKREAKRQRQAQPA